MREQTLSISAPDLGIPEVEFELDKKTTKLTKSSKKTSLKKSKSKSRSSKPVKLIVEEPHTLAQPENEPESETRKLQTAHVASEPSLPSQSTPQTKKKKSSSKLSGLTKKKKSRQSENSVAKITQTLPEPDQEEKKESPESQLTKPSEVPKAEPEVSEVLVRSSCECDHSAESHSSKKLKRKTESSSKRKHSTPRSSKKTDATPEKRRRRKRRTHTHSEDEEEDDFGFGDPFVLEASEDDDDFTCLTEADIIAEQTREIQEVSEVLSVTSSAAITLLKFFKWNRDKLMTAYFDNPSGTLQKAGVSGDATLTNSTILSSSPMVLDGNDFECSICAVDVPSDEVYTLGPCNHSFCTNCWEHYLRLQITEGQVYINCPHINCLSLVQESSVKQLVCEEVYRKYCTYFMQSFVDNNDNVKWCPAPGCGNAVTSDMIYGQTVTCSCNYRFCFQCSEEAHLPATCEHIRNWKKKCQDESETNNWIAANTQECPKCGLPTEKNGGCNHMTCRQCKHEYCWICAKDWKGHNDFYTCNRYQKKSSKEEKKSTKKSSRKERELQRLAMRKALEKYLHYYSRFTNHTRSSELERVREKALIKMQEIQETEATAAEVLFIKQASDCLIVCRSVLKYSYVLHYYMDENDPQRDLLEYLQEDLEKTVEQLSELMEHPMKHKIDIVNLTRLANTRMNNLLDAASCNDV